MTLFILFIAVLYIELRFSPRVEYLEEESLLILFYGEKNTRKRKIFKL
jgi:hypothetical protein